MKKLILLIVVLLLGVSVCSFGEVAQETDIEMHAVNSITVAGGASSALTDCKDIKVKGLMRTLVVQTELTFNGAATEDVTIEVYTSIDGTIWDTDTLTSWKVSVSAGNKVIVSKLINGDAVHYKFIVNNVADANSVTGVIIRTAVKN